jgi:hypothetical protein
LRRAVQQLPEIEFARQPATELDSA